MCMLACLPACLPYRLIILNFPCSLTHFLVNLVARRAVVVRPPPHASPAEDKVRKLMLMLVLMLILIPALISPF